MTLIVQSLVSGSGSSTLLRGRRSEPYDRETVERMYRYLSEHGELYIIDVRDNGAWHSIGDSTLCPDVIPIVIGDARSSGHGIGPRVIRLLIGREKTLGWVRTVGKVYSYNHRSQRMFASLGFRCVGEFIDDKGGFCIKMELMLDSDKKE